MADSESVMPNDIILDGPIWHFEEKYVMPESIHNLTYIPSSESTIFIRVSHLAALETRYVYCLVLLVAQSFIVANNIRVFIPEYCHSIPILNFNFFFFSN